MAKKRTNPNKIPISPDSYDLDQITHELINGNILKVWALVLGAFVDFEGVSTEKLIRLWDDVNAFSSTVRGSAFIERDLKQIEQITGLSRPYEHIPHTNIKTVGDLEKYKKKSLKNALYSSFALIANPIIQGNLLCEEDIALLFRKAYALDEELCQGRISVLDIQMMLMEEFSVCLFEHHGDVHLYKGVSSADCLQLFEMMSNPEMYPDPGP